MSGTAPRALLVTGEYPPAVGGVGDYTATLAAGLRAAGAPAAVLTGRGAALPGETGVCRTAPGWGFASWPAATRALRASRADLAHIQYQAGAFQGRGAINLLPWWLKRPRRGTPTPAVVTFHDLHAPYLFPKAGPLRERALRTMARGCAAVVATNGEDWRQLRADARLCHHLHLIPIGSNIPPLPDDQQAQARAAVRGRLGLGDNTTLVAYFGLVSASKGVAALLDALAGAHAMGQSEYHLLVIGGEASATDRATFPLGDDLAGALRRRGLAGRVTVTGALPVPEVAAHLAAADCAVLPYRDGASWRRGSLLAALAAGVPLVTTVPGAGYDAGGALPLLRDGENAMLVLPDDVRAIAAALGRLADDDALRSRLATGARALADPFRWETIVDAHLELYQAILTRGEARP